MANKNTRLVYTDEMNLNIYRSLPDKDFKEFMMAYLTYQKGDNIDSMFTSLLAKTLFMTYISKIEYNESKWEKRAKANQENGKKGGRPKKIDIEPNIEFETAFEEPVTIEKEDIKPIAQTPDASPTDVEEFNDNDFRYGEIDTTDPMLSFLIEDEDEETFDDKIKRYIPYLKEVEYGSNEFYNRMKKVIADFPMGEKKYADQEIKRILAA